VVFKSLPLNKTSSVLKSINLNAPFILILNLFFSAKIKILTYKGFSFKAKHKLFKKINKIIKIRKDLLIFSVENIAKIENSK
jgi:hypothetical protein